MKLRFAMFYHSLVSDWNHGNAHFLRGVAAELLSRGHQVTVYEPEDSWSKENLLRDYGSAAIDRFHNAFPLLRSCFYKLVDLDLSRLLDATDLVLVHEWNDPRLVAAIGHLRRERNDLRIFFHDTHHRAITAQKEMQRFELDRYDGVLAYGQSLKQAYQRLGWGKQVYVWHEAADVRTFYPRPTDRVEGDVIWIGNWGDEERSEELREYLIEPVRRGGWRARVHGVRYPAQAVTALQDAGIEYRGWVPNFEVPAAFANFRATVHVPRRPYREQLSGIPTIRPFEALACGIPMVSAPWNDSEDLFRVGQDFLMAENGLDMENKLYDVLNDSTLARSLSASGLETIRSRHTCGHRINELLAIHDSVKPVKDQQVSSVRAEVYQ